MSTGQSRETHEEITTMEKTTYTKRPALATYTKFESVDEALAVLQQDPDARQQVLERNGMLF